MKQADPRNIFKMAFNLSVSGISRPLVYYSINFFSYENSRNPGDPEPADQGYIQMEYSCLI
jgi:hypothetical protein